VDIVKKQSTFSNCLLDSFQILNQLQGNQKLSNKIKQSVLAPKRNQERVHSILSLQHVNALLSEFAFELFDLFLELLALIFSFVVFFLPRQAFLLRIIFIMFVLTLIAHFRNFLLMLPTIPIIFDLHTLIHTPPTLKLPPLITSVL
jgi:hypothetical protein